MLSGAKDAIIKVKSELVERTYKGLKMKPGDVMIGARRCKIKDTQNQASAMGVSRSPPGDDAWIDGARRENLVAPA